MKQIVTPLLAFGALFLCVNFGTPSEDGPTKGPRINFFGTISIRSENTADTTRVEKDKEIRATPAAPSGEENRSTKEKDALHKEPCENVLIGGLYEKIPVYRIPRSPEISPTDVTTYLKLDDIESIRPAKFPPKAAVSKYHGRDYIEIVVTLKPKQAETHPTERHFLVEATRKIFCDLVTIAGSLEQETLFEALHELVILGFRHRERRSSEKTSAKPLSAAEEVLCSEAKNNLKEIKKTTSSPNLIKPVEDLVGYFCKKS